jgi:hypothetical protein
MAMKGLGEAAVVAEACTFQNLTFGARRIVAASAASKWKNSMRELYAGGEGAVSGAGE